MFNFGGNNGNPNLSFSRGTAPSNTAPFKAPTQGQIGSGVDPMMLMQMMSMMNNKDNAPQAQTFGGEKVAPLMSVGQGNVIPEQYSQSVLKAMGRI